MRKKLLTLAVLLLPMILLASCGTSTQGTNLGTPTPSGKPAVCLSLEHITPNRGKPGVTPEDITAALARDSPIGRVRNVVGDNASTLIQIDKNNAALDSLCGSP